MRSRRFIPSVSQLLAFEAVFRTSSATGAGKELNLTQSTVSRLVQNLEAQLGQALFIRDRKRMLPTDAAASYFEDISSALDMIQRAGMTLVANPNGGALSLAVLPTFGTRWLAPRLGQFLQANPGVTVNLSTRVQRFSFETEKVDAVIFFGKPDWADATHQKLFDESLTACASPDFLRANPVDHPADMAHLPLLQLETRLNAWAVWFQAQGAVRQAGAGMLMDQFSMMIQAAISGLGIALLPDYLARVEIAERRLLPVLTPGISGTGSYWLAWPRSKERHAPLRAFRAWLASIEPQPHGTDQQHERVSTPALR